MKVPIPDKKIIVTGISGFVGLNLKKYLSDDYRLIGVSRCNGTNKNLLKYNDLSKDLLNESKVFIHLAGKAHDLKNTSEDNDYFEVNTELTKRLFDKFLVSDCEVFYLYEFCKSYCRCCRWCFNRRCNS